MDGNPANTHSHLCQIEKWGVQAGPGLRDCPGASSKKYIHNGVDYSAVFDPVYYLGHYQDLRNAFGNNYDLAFKHFISNGMKEARIAKESFNVVQLQEQIC